jgi:hypothetical protein
MTARCDLKHLTHQQKDALIQELWDRLDQYESVVQQHQKRLEQLEEHFSKSYPEKD